MLHITNGDSLAGSLRASGVSGEILPWRDILHEGPVPAGLSLAELRTVRARFISDQGWGELADVSRDFERRDGVLERFGEHREIVLWFEHDLYDQLQILQVLDFFADRDLSGIRLALVPVDRCLEEIERFHGLGQLTPEQLPALFDERGAVTRLQLDLAVSAWRAFRAPDPTAIGQLLDEDTSALPYLAAALRRHLEQFPSTVHGLGRTERQILEGVAAGPRRPVDLFTEDKEREESPFLGDSTFWSYLGRLASCDRPLLRLSSPVSSPHFARSEVALTEDGRRVLAGEEDQLQINGIDRWLGGVHLRGRTAWRWDAEEGLSGPR